MDELIEPGDEAEDASVIVTGPPLMSQDRLVQFSGQCWISDEDLEGGGYDCVSVGTVIRFYPRSGVAERDAIWFELAGRANTRGFNLSGWWLQRLPSPEEMFADLPVIEGTDDDGRPT